MWRSTGVDAFRRGEEMKKNTLRRRDNKNRGNYIRSPPWQDASPDHKPLRARFALDVLATSRGRFFEFV